MAVCLEQTTSTSSNASTAETDYHVLQHLQTQVLHISEFSRIIIEKRIFKNLPFQ
jgi:hypothetical protein